MLFVESLIIGFLLAVPVGPNGVLCIRRTLKAGWRAGFVTGLGGGLADVVFGAIAGSGSSFVKAEVAKWEQPIRLVGGLVLLCFATYIFKSKPPQIQNEKNSEGESGGLIRYFLSGLALAASNPSVIFTFATVYLALGFAAQVEGHPAHFLFFMSGLGLGASLWFGVLSAITAGLSDKFSHRVLERINQLCAVFIVIAACYSLGVWRRRR